VNPSPFFVPRPVDTVELYHGAGYVRLVETWGSDERIVESARMSTDGAFRGWGPRSCQTCAGTGHVSTTSTGPGFAIAHDVDCPGCQGKGSLPGDEKLLRYLHEHHHATPFEFAGMAVEFQVPIFVIRQIHRHRAAGYNELSGRYTEMSESFWLPQPSDIRRQGGSNKQGSLADDSEGWQARAKVAAEMIEASCMASWGWYRQLVELGVAKEQARAVLPLAQMTRCRMTTSLRMWLHFLGLRLDSHAQPETRDVAEACAGFLRGAFPRTMGLFDEGREGGAP